MRTGLVLALLLAAGAAGVEAQRKPGGLATLAISVTDPAGTPLGGVKVIVEGPANKTTRTERGRVALEELPTGAYKLRFELDGFVPLERELTARAGKPIDVKVTLNPAPKPPPPPAPVPPPRPPVLKVDPAAIDIPGFQEKNYVGKAPAKTSVLTCATGGAAVLLQVRDPFPQHVHDESDEFVYVIGGEGTGRVGGTEHRMQRWHAADGAAWRGARLHCATKSACRSFDHGWRALSEIDRGTSSPGPAGAPVARLTC